MPLLRTGSRQSRQPHRLGDRRQLSWPDEAKQAAAADEQFVDAVTNRLVAKYDRFTFQRIAMSDGKAEHLNSGFLW
ncbi:MAG TPA: hypothetical protein VHZ24_16390 [Pirellulales bacterium]|jgi:hypothetical protein|nr:hypothetical protein [Pirellulales bacterium]